MRSEHLRWVAPLACLGVLAISGSASATVVWTSGFETGDLSEWTPGINATKTLAGGMVRQNVVVQQAQVYAGKYACESTVHPDDLFGQYVQDRVDIQHQSTLTAESGCAVSCVRARPAPLASVLAILGLALARRRRAGVEQGASPARTRRARH